MLRGIRLTAKTVQMNARSLTASYTYDNEGRRTGVKYPDTYFEYPSILDLIVGPTYTTTYDTTGRPSGMTQAGGSAVVQSVLYNAAGQMTQMQWMGNVDTRQYNNRLQMTRLTTKIEGHAEALLDREYRCSATQNNGRITSQKDYVSGEEVTYH